MKIEDIYNNFQLRAEVSVILRTGQQFGGTLVGVSESSITLRPSSGGNLVLSAEAIDCIFPASTTQPPSIASFSSLPAPVAETRPLAGDSTISPLPPPTAAPLLYPPEVINQVTEVAALYKGAIQQATFEPLPPEFKLPLSLPFSVRKSRMEGEWNRLKDQYLYATKIKDFSRLAQIIRGYEQIVNKYSELSAAARFNLGCLQFELGQTTEALKTFELAIAHTRTSQLFYNLAAIALKRNDFAKACYALQEFFKLSSPTDHSLVWHTFLRVLLECHAVQLFPELLKQALQEKCHSDVHLILKSVVFVLKTHEETDSANEVMAWLLQDRLEPEQTLTLVESRLGRLNLEPIADYSKQQQKLQETQAQAKLQEAQRKNQKQVAALLNEAAQLERKQQHSQALPLVRKVLQLDANNQQAKQLETDLLEYSRQQSLQSRRSSGNGPYAKARNAREDKKFNEAENLFLEAIRTKDSFDSAINDLASMYLQQVRDTDAIDLLVKYQNQVSNPSASYNLLADAYKRGGKYRDEIRCLQQVLNITSSQPKRYYPVLKRISIAQAKLRDFEKSESNLKSYLRAFPDEENAQRLLEKVQGAIETGNYTELDTYIDNQEDKDARTRYSLFLASHVERCKYEGVDASKKVSKQFTEGDAKKLRNTADAPRHPHERAEYYLSAAKILIDNLRIQPEEARPSIDLRNFCAAMGDACVSEQKHKDVTRTYYAEAFAVAPEWAPQLSVKLVQYIMLYYSTPEEVLKANEQTAIESCLSELLLKRQNLGSAAIEGLVYLSWLNSKVRDEIMRSTQHSKRLTAEIQTRCYQMLGEQEEQTTDSSEAAKVLLELWNRCRDLMSQRYQKIKDELAVLNSLAHSLTSIPDQIERIQQLDQKVRGTLDREYLKTIKDILNKIYEYSQQPSYDGRQDYEPTIRERVTQLSKKIEDNPTKDSLELFRPYLLLLWKTVEKDFDEVRQAAEPEKLKIELSLPFYTPDTKSRVECQITISNEQGKSPVNAIKILVQDSPNGEYSPEDKTVSVPERLYGGKSKTCVIPVIVTEKAKQSQVFTLYYELSYRTRTENQINTSNAQAIPLYPAENFEEIENPYHYGLPVSDANMFFGRQQMIENLLAAIRKNSLAKSLVIYGQKRTGKSSVLLHLKRQLTLPVIPVYFSLGDVDDPSNTALHDDPALGTFLYTIIRRIEATFKNLAGEGYPSVEVERPILERFIQAPRNEFQDYMEELKRILKPIPAYRDVRLMLLLDEFTYIYEEINKGNIKDTFMRAWKALLEAGHFGAVLVGQDVMPQFTERFPNEFQVAESLRVSYLAPEDAHDLIVKPIKIPGTEESRYKGEAVKRLIELTAGNPYYIQIFCYRLVNYMNSKKAIYVTDADIERVKNGLIRGNDALQKTDFDNLIRAADGISDMTLPEDAEAVLREIANGSHTPDAYCDRTAITAEMSQAKSIDEVLDDLVKRDVVEKSGVSRYRIRVRLFTEWLLAHQ
jgi:hypothetical protein